MDTGSYCKMEYSHQASFGCRKQKVKVAEVNGGLLRAHKDVRHALGETGRTSGLEVAPSSCLSIPILYSHGLYLLLPPSPSTSQLIRVYTVTYTAQPARRTPFGDSSPTDSSVLATSLKFLRETL